MKRILSFLFIALFLLSSCSEKKNVTTEDVPEKETGVSVSAPASEERETQKETREEIETVPTYNETVQDRSAKEKLEAIPVANSSMSSDQLRQICLDYMRLQLSFPWTPTEALIHDNLNVNRYPGKVYGGIPYLSTGSGNLYRAMEFYDPETGRIDTTAFKKDVARFSNACSGGAFWAWGRVINSANYSWTWSITQYNGFVNVGPYTYSKTLENFHEANSTSPNKYTAKNVVLENDEQTMYESYALLLPADGLVHPGHVRMNASVPTVVRNADGTIDGKKSFTTYCDQVKYTDEAHHKRTQEDGTEYRVQGGVDVQISFEELYRTYYIPFTFKEFLGTDPVEKAEVTLSVPEGVVSIRELAKAKLEANYAISDVFLNILSPEGDVLYSRVRRMDDFFTREVSFQKEVFVSSVIRDTEGFEEGGKNRVEISCQLSTGERLTVYTATLAAA
ncbi:MAG: hypothetical protein IKC69_06850 [Clostridia bacterium]|nr:hypothetical protein [Clostridia bacterium]